ncbi:SpaA isopeptide-forming pilin-related protein [Enterococcus hirae]|uniref:MSCRAMM family protein n=1 Tax=Enterococcus hirae TaxID=1354 RepID=UPI003F275ECF
MKFFKVKEPCYYALIAAKDEEECMDLYERVVTDIEDREEFVRCLQELDRNEAIEENAKTISEETLEPMFLLSLSGSISQPFPINLNVLKNGNTKIKKVDADTGKAISGAKFKLSYGGKQVEVVTNANGEADLKDVLHGTKVTIQEMQAAKWI